MVVWTREISAPTPAHLTGQGGWGQKPGQGFDACLLLGDGARNKSGGAFLVSQKKRASA